MEAMVCEKCGSTKIQEKDGYLFCENCGTKFFSPKATGDESQQERKKLLALANRSLDAGQIDDAAEYYKKVQEKDPNCWEPPFFLAMISATKLAAVGDFISACKTIERIFEVVAGILFDKETQTDEIRQDAFDRTVSVTKSLCGKMHLTAITNHSSDSSYESDCRFVENCKEIALAYTACGMYMGGMDREFLNGRNKEKTLEVLKSAVQVCSSASSLTTDGFQSFIGSIANEIRKSDPDYQTPVLPRRGASSSNGQSSGGCYIASCVYGSYDCPSVWVLRRYRDQTLSSSIAGRMFIRVYYAVSPRLIKLFGKKEWFKRFWKKHLDRIVTKLKVKGFSDKPYQD